MDDVDVGKSRLPWTAASDRVGRATAFGGDRRAPGRRRRPWARCGRGGVGVRAACGRRAGGVRAAWEASAPVRGGGGQHRWGGGQHRRRAGGRGARAG
jgi:hypothetical protein